MGVWARTSAEMSRASARGNFADWYYGCAVPGSSHAYRNLMAYAGGN